MGRIVLQAFVTLDGIAQAPGRADEDRDGGFEHGGWQMDFAREHGPDDPNVVVEWEERTAALLLGRRTYEIFAGSWGVWSEDADGLQGEFTRRYNRVPKLIASRTLTDLGWRNSRLLGDDLPGEIARARDAIDGEIRVWGSTVLVRTLLEHDLLDELRLLVHPLVLGTGKRLLPQGLPPKRFELVEHRALPSGVLVAVHRRP